MKIKFLNKIRNNVRNFIHKNLVFLVPTLIYDNIEKITPQKLRELNVDTILLDLDNTLVPWNKKQIPNAICKYLSSLKEAGFKICIVSNALPIRVKKISEELNIPYIALAAKPSTRPLRKAIKILNSNIENTVIIGDQLFTDILAGNRLGIKTILVRPLAKFELVTSKFIRLIEKKILSYLAKKNYISSKEVKIEK
ncbi:MAG: YqeG family HAD IIIA-type phosphatase [Candidatus Calescibacterium sp.]|nr:YqeG family HAD IIIA-type phosphatase [Candidatus Calescibacterium sp.]MDW8132190.1 YqeG family HAD IIIA-type phosphatase [Candidatus Calescibacterium sp.]